MDAQHSHRAYNFLDLIVTAHLVHRIDEPQGLGGIAGLNRLAKGVDLVTHDASPHVAMSRPPAAVVPHLQHARALNRQLNKISDTQDTARAHYGSCCRGATLARASRSVPGVVA